MAIQRAQGATPTSATCAPTSGAAGTSTDGTPPPLLPDPTGSLVDSGDPAATLAALLVKAGQEAKRGDRELEGAEEKMQIDAENGEIDAMRAKAHDTRTQAWASAGTSIASGALTMCAGATYGAGTNASGTSRLFEGGAKVADAGGHIADGLFKGDIADDETRTRQNEQIANRAKRAVDQAHDMQKDDSELIKTAIDFYREYTGAQAQARGAALHRT